MKICVLWQLKWRLWWWKPFRIKIDKSKVVKTYLEN
jgi:hypothetical protein